MTRGASPVELEAAGDRVRIARALPSRPDAELVLYWMIAARRTSHNAALDRAIAWARTLDRPLVVLEPLRCDYRWASDRLHRFVIDGMADNARHLRRGPVLHYPYVEPRVGAGRGLLATLAARACVVVTDEYPSFFLPRMVAHAAQTIDSRLEAVDSNGLLPVASAPRAFEQAAHFRWHVQRTLPRELDRAPAPEPLKRLRLPRLASLGSAVERRWPAASAALLEGEPSALAGLPIDHGVPVAPTRGGSAEAERALQRFVDQRLAGYAERRNHPDDDATSRLSPYLHFGHLSVHAVLQAVARAEAWSPDRIARRPNGSREGWWGMSPSAEAFLDELVTWRELALNGCAHRPDDYLRYQALPPWALATLDAHRRDERPHLYALDQLEQARTHDPLWNAAQRQLLHEGWFHGYLRMLWAKKILEWSPTPEEAFTTMMRIMDRHSLDGRDPNSYAGYAWTLGRYDRPWPERAVFGKVRSMSSDRVAAKVRVSRYLQKYG